MIASDTSSLVAYFNGIAGPDVDRIAAALAGGELALPPVVLTEILSDPTGAPAIERQIGLIRLMEILDGHWLRAAQARRAILRHGFKARLGDALIAQSCIDHGVPLITRDRDFRHFAEHCGLKLV